MAEKDLMSSVVEEMVLGTRVNGLSAEEDDEPTAGGCGREPAAAEKAAADE